MPSMGTFSKWISSIRQNCTMHTTIIHFTESESLCYPVDDADMTSGMAATCCEFDFTEYLRDHPLYNEDNMKVVGKFKVEFHGCKMTTFVGLRPKINRYAYTNTNNVNVELKTAKGVKTKVKSIKLAFVNYEHSLRYMSLKTVSMYMMRS